MTISNPPVSEVGAAVQASSHRRAFSAFIRSEGLVTVGDLTPTGDPSTMAVNFSTGGVWIQLPDGTYDILYSDAVEPRSIASPPGSGSRTDLIYAGMQSKEFGNAVNVNQLYVKTNPSAGTAIPPDPDVMAGAYPIAKLLVPSTATKGSDCTITLLSQTTAPTRSGGYTGGDLILPTQPFLWWHRSGIGSGGHILADNPCPFVPSMVQAIGVFPHSGAYRPGVFQPDLSAFAAGHYEGWWYGPTGAALTVDPGIGYAEWVAIMYPGAPLASP